MEYEHVTDTDLPFKSEVLRVTFGTLAFEPMTVLLSQSTPLILYRFLGGGVGGG